MRDPSRRSPGWARLLVAATAGAVLLPSAGYAATASERPWFDVDDLYPGARVTQVVTLDNDDDVPMAVHLRVSDVIDDENGCVEPEQHVATELCEPTAASSATGSAWS